MARGKPSINEEDLESMHYLKAVIKENLRYHALIHYWLENPANMSKLWAMASKPEQQSSSTLGQLVGIPRCGATMQRSFCQRESLAALRW